VGVGLVVFDTISRYDNLKKLIKIVFFEKSHGGAKVSACPRGKTFPPRGQSFEKNAKTLKNLDMLEV
jgi:hypothetical protein